MQKLDLKKQAGQFIGKAINVQHGEAIWIEYEGENARPLAEACAEYANDAGAKLRMIDRGSAYLNNFLAAANREILQETAKTEFDIMKSMNTYACLTAEAGIQGTGVPAMRLMVEGATNEAHQIYCTFVLDYGTQVGNHELKTLGWIDFSVPRLGAQL